MIDATDLQILTILQSNAPASNADIARQVGRAPSAILERIRTLEQRGVIQGYEARIDPTALGLGMLAYVAVRTDERVGDECAGERLARIPEVQEVHHVAGEEWVGEAGGAATIKGAGGFIKIDGAGVTISGTMVWINERGEPNDGKVARPQDPFEERDQEPPPPDNDEADDTLDDQ